jgi:hypothetical protein
MSAMPMAGEARPPYPCYKEASEPNDNNNNGTTEETPCCP